LVAHCMVKQVSPSEVSQGEKTLYSGTDSQSCMTEYTSVHEGEQVSSREAGWENEIASLLPDNQRQRHTCYALCHIWYSVPSAHASIFRMDSNSTSYRRMGEGKRRAPIASFSPRQSRCEGTHFRGKRGEGEGKAAPLSLSHTPTHTLPLALSLPLSLSLSA